MIKKIVINEKGQHVFKKQLITLLLLLVYTLSYSSEGPPMEFAEKLQPLPDVFELMFPIEEHIELSKDMTREIVREELGFLREAHDHEKERLKNIQQNQELIFNQLRTLRHISTNESPDGFSNCERPSKKRKREEAPQKKYEEFLVGLGNSFENLDKLFSELVKVENLEKDVALKFDKNISDFLYGIQAYFLLIVANKVCHTDNEVALSIFDLVLQKKDLCRQSEDKILDGLIERFRADLEKKESELLSETHEGLSK